MGQRIRLSMGIGRVEKDKVEKLGQGERGKKSIEDVFSHTGGENE